MVSRRFRRGCGLGQDRGDLGFPVHSPVRSAVRPHVNDQGTALLDEAYSYDPANPIVGGTEEDLVYLKVVEGQDGFETGDPVTRNVNFGNTFRRYRPRYAQLRVKLTF